MSKTYNPKKGKKEDNPWVLVRQGTKNGRNIIKNAELKVGEKACGVSRERQSPEGIPRVNFSFCFKKNVSLKMDINIG